MAASPPIRTNFFYGWVVVAVAFVSMGIAVNTRTAFSLLYPPILDDFGWDRGETAGAFSLGFLASTAAVPLVGMLIDRSGPRVGRDPQGFPRADVHGLEDRGRGAVVVGDGQLHEP